MSLETDGGIFAEPARFHALPSAELAAVRQVVRGTGHSVVPLVFAHRRHEILAPAAQFKLRAIAAFTISCVGEQAASADPIVVPPEGMARATFLGICLGLTEPLQEPVCVPGQDIMTLARSTHRVATGVAEFSHATDATVAMPALIVPRLLVATLRGDEERATTVAAAMFDTFAGMYINQN